MQGALRLTRTIPYRSTATGTHNGFSKIGAAAGTFLTEIVDAYGIRYSILIFCCVLLVSSLATLLLQHETRGMSLRDDIDLDPCTPDPPEEEKCFGMVSPSSHQNYGTESPSTSRAEHGLQGNETESPKTFES